MSRYRLHQHEQRIAVVSDTHGQIHPEALRRVAQCDVAVHCGDIGSEAVLSALQPASGRVYAVRGNNDEAGKWQGRSNPALLPERVCLESPLGMIAVIHGHQTRNARTRHRWLRSTFPDCIAVCYGHSHHRALDRDERPWVLNPGACGRARAYGGPSMMVLMLGATLLVETIHLS